MNAAAMPAAAQALAQALRAAATDAADQVRLLLALAESTTPGPFGALLRRMALAELAQASAAYQPTSYDDALAVRRLVCDALDAEILAAADGGEDEVYTALRALRIAVTLDLRSRGDLLPRLRDITVPPLPAPVLAYRLYGDAARADDLVARADPPNPVFMPTELRVLSR